LKTPIYTIDITVNAAIFACLLFKVPEFVVDKLLMIGGNLAPEMQLLQKQQLAFNFDF
jgi:hypothetical protein